MANIFDIFEQELVCDMAYVESAIATAKYEMISDPDTFMEAGGSGNIFQKLIEKVKEIVEKAINTIKQFFASKQVESNMKKAEEVAKENPGLLKKKIKVKDYEKLDKINKKAQEDLKKCKNKAQVDDVMAKYRKQRNIAIGVGAAVTVTLGACLIFSRKKGKENEAKLNKRLGETQSQIKALESEYAKATKELYKTDQSLQRARLGNVLKREKLDEFEKSASGLIKKLSEENQNLFKKNMGLQSKNFELQSQLDIAKAQLELLNNSASDSVAQSKEFALKWMQVGSAAEQANQKRHLRRNRENYIKMNADDPVRAEKGKRTLPDKIESERVATDKFISKLDSALAATHKDYGRVLNRINILEKYIDNEEFIKSHNLNPSDMKAELSEKKQELLELRKKYKPI